MRFLVLFVLIASSVYAEDLYKYELKDGREGVGSIVIEGEWATIKIYVNGKPLGDLKVAKNDIVSQIPYKEEKPTDILGNPIASELQRTLDAIEAKSEERERLRKQAMVIESDIESLTEQLHQIYYNANKTKWLKLLNDFDGVEKWEVPNDKVIIARCDTVENVKDDKANLTRLAAVAGRYNGDHCLVRYRSVLEKYYGFDYAGIEGPENLWQDQIEKALLEKRAKEIEAREEAARQEREEREEAERLKKLKAEQEAKLKKKIEEDKKVKGNKGRPRSWP